jgi:putative peptidoglycan lipid II flippase
MPAEDEVAAPVSSGRHATLVAIGIFLSRIAGLVRQKALAHYLGSTVAADAFNAAFRIPNLLQNLFGEGALSASFIPVYARLLAEGKPEEADRVAGAVGTLLALTSAVLVAIGIALAPWLVDLLALGFDDATYALTVELVRIVFPGVGILVTSAWCLGILNSHRKFLLSYTAPIVWNAAMIAAFLGFGPRATTNELAVAVSAASIVGAVLQFAIQVPAVLGVTRRLRPSLDYRDPYVAEVIRNFGPAFLGRGVMQISSYVDSMLASLLPSGSVAVFGYAQTLYTLPISLFGMSVSAAELPAMAEATGSEAEIAAALRTRLDGGLARIAFFVVPSAVAFVFLGDVIAAGLFQGGQFDRDDSVRVWATLAGSSVGMLAQTWGRLYASAWYALQDTRTPLRFALLRVALTTVLGWWFSTRLPGILGVDPQWGVAGLTASAGIAGWIEYALLKNSLERRIGRTGIPALTVAKLWAAGLVAAAIGIGVKLAIFALHPVLVAIAVCGTFGVVYLGIAGAMGFPEVRGVLRRLRVVRGP